MSFFTRKTSMDELEILPAFTLNEAQEAEGVKVSKQIVRNGIEECQANSDLATYWVLITKPDRVIESSSLIKERSDWHAWYYGWIQSMYILPEYRGNYLIRFLLSAIVKQARIENLHDLRLYVHEDNTKVIKAYNNNGFKNNPYKILSLNILNE